MDENPYKAPAETSNPTNVRSDWRPLAVIFYWTPIVVLTAIAIGLILASALMGAV